VPQIESGLAEVEASVAVRAQSGAGRAPRTGFGRLDSMPLRRKLDILVIAPLVIILLLIGPACYGEIHDADQWHSAQAELSQSEQLGALLNDLEIEQAVAVGLQGVAGLPGDANLVTVRELKQYAAQTDAQLALVRKNLDPAVSSSLGQALAEVTWETQGISGARASAYQPTAAKSAAVEVGYTTAITSLYGAIDLDALAASGSPAAFDGAELYFLYNSDMHEHDREIDLLAMTNQADFDTESGGTAILDESDLTAAQQDEGVAEDEAESFGAIASGADQATFQNATNTTAQRYVNVEQQYVSEKLAASDPAEAIDQVLTANQVSMSGAEGLSSTLGLVQATVQAHQQRGVMEAQIASDVIAGARHEARNEEWYAFALVIGAIAVLLLLLALEYRVRRSVVAPMIQLTEAAAQIADVTRADLERVADEDDEGDPQAVPVFETVPVVTRDEIGMLADAFNRVQDSAVRVLERQIAVRRNTAEMFGNVGRRIHNLTGRQLSLIDAAEREETDPSVLERLYRIDHIAVRLQRGADSLMLLSGETEPALGDSPLRLTDVVRSAVGRVEGYQRVVLSAEGDVTVAPAAVGDLTLIVAELVENAVSFSPQTSAVDISVRPADRGALVEVVDHGVGMTSARLAEENARLVRRERLDLAPTKVLGLFVVGRLARRCGIVVRLAATAGGGVTVRLDIGAGLLFDATEPPARRPGPAQAARPSSRPGIAGSTLPEQRVTRAETPGAPPRPILPPAHFRFPTPPATTPPAPSSAEGGGPSGPETMVPKGFDALPRRHSAPQRDRQPAAPDPANGHPVPGQVPTDAPTEPPRPVSGANGSANGLVNGAKQARPDAAPDAASADGFARRLRAAAAEAPLFEPEQANDASPLPRRRAAPEPARPEALAEPPAPAPAPEPDAAPGALPRRSRTRAALREPAPSVASMLADAHLLDAEAARAAVEEFEAGVEEAMRVSAQNLPTLRASDEPEGIRP
jgi:signal transduction histidine kinase